MIKLSILSHFIPRKIFVIIFVLGGDESVDHRRSAYSALEDRMFLTHIVGRVSPEGVM